MNHSEIPNPLAAPQYLLLSKLGFMEVQPVHPKVPPAAFVSPLNYILLAFTNTTFKLLSMLIKVLMLLFSITSTLFECVSCHMLYLLK